MPVINNLDAEAVGVALGTEGDAARAGVFDRVRYEVAQDLLDEGGIAVNALGAASDLQPQSLAGGNTHELVLDLVEELFDRKIGPLRFDGARFELADVE